MISAKYNYSCQHNDRNFVVYAVITHKQDRKATFLIPNHVFRALGGNNSWRDATSGMKAVREADDLLPWDHPDKLFKWTTLENNSSIDDLIDQASFTSRGMAFPMPDGKTYMLLIGISYGHVRSTQNIVIFMWRCLCTDVVALHVLFAERTITLCPLLTVDCCATTFKCFGQWCIF